MAATAKTPEFNFAGLKFEVGRADQFTDARLLEMQEIGFVSFVAAARAGEGGLTEAEIRNHVLHYDDKDYWVANHRDPQIAVARGDLNEADFAESRVVAAYQGETMVGFLTSWETASGSSARVRQMKMSMPPQLHFVPKIGGRRYAWQREIAVHPEFQHRGIGHALGYLSITQRHPWRQVTDYVNLGVAPGLGMYQEGLGMRYTGPGSSRQTDSGREIGLSRYQGRGGRVAKEIMSLPGFKDAIEGATIIRHTPHYPSDGMFARKEKLPQPQPLSEEERNHWPGGGVDK